MIDQKVDEKWAKFQAEYDELNSKVKKNIGGMFKPGMMSGAGRAGTQSESVKGRTSQNG